MFLNESSPGIVAWNGGTRRGRGKRERERERERERRGQKGGEEEGQINLWGKLKALQARWCTVLPWAHLFFIFLSDRSRFPELLLYLVVLVPGAGLFPSIFSSGQMGCAPRDTSESSSRRG